MSFHRGFLAAQDTIACLEPRENGEDLEWQLCKSEGLVAVPWHFQNIWSNAEHSIWKSYTLDLKALVVVGKLMKLMGKSKTMRLGIPV